MNTIRAFDKSPKYSSSEYERVSAGIYKYKNRYVTSLSFQQEPDLGEGKNAADISQYPLEDILDQFAVYVSDFHKDLNSSDSKTCVLEFAGFSIEDIQKLRQLIGKHVYNREKNENGQTFIELVIE